MTQPTRSSENSVGASLPRSVKVVGLASLVNDTASEMIYPLLPRNMCVPVRETEIAHHADLHDSIPASLNCPVRLLYRSNRRRV